MAGFLGLLWAIQLANWADSYGLDTSFGIVPHSQSHLADIFTAPFLHFSWQHLEGNSVPLLVLGFLAAYRGIAKFIGGHGHRRDHQRPGGVAVPVQQRAHGRRERAHLRVLRLRGGARAVRPELRGRDRGALAAVAYAYILTVAIPGTPRSQLDRPRRRPGGRRAGGLDPAHPPAPGRHGRARLPHGQRTARGPPCTKNSTTWACNAGHGPGSLDYRRRFSASARGRSAPFMKGGQAA